MPQTLGFIGLGIMGRPMAHNLLETGYVLTVHNRSQPGMDELVAAGAKEAGAPAEVAAKSDVVFTMLPDSPDVETVVLGPQGVLEGAEAGDTIIDMSTIAPDVTRRVAKAATEKGIHMLDAPVSGSDKGAREKTLSIMVGGPKEVFEACLPLLNVLGSRVVYAGECGMGETVKLCNQIMGSLTLLAVCEGLMLGAKAGADLEAVLEATSGGAAKSWMLENLGPKITERDFDPGFMVKLMQKDLRLALALAGDLNAALPGTGLVHQLYRSVEADGKRNEGIQALARALEKLAGVEIRE